MKSKKSSFGAIFFLTLFIVIGAFLYTTSTEAVAQSECDNSRCDFRPGQESSCNIFSDGNECIYYEKACVGWRVCGTEDPEEA